VSFLENEQPFPNLSGPTLEHGELTLPDDLNREWTAVLFYRGEW